MTDDSSPQLLIVDDDAGLRSFLAEELRAAGYCVLEASTGRAALAAGREPAVDLVMLDWMLPDCSGVEVCRELRSLGHNVPVLMLSGRDGLHDRREALEAGANDYLVKPFSMEELLAHVQTIISNNREGETTETAPLQIEDLTVLEREREVYKAGMHIQLTSREFDLLVMLMRHHNKVVPRKMLLHTLWGESSIGDPSILDVYISHLSRKLNATGKGSLIHNVQDVGFMLSERLAQLPTPDDRVGSLASGTCN